MSDELYQTRIVALAKSKTGAGKLTAPTRSARRDNPLCGDRVTIDVTLDDTGHIAEIAHQVRGCLLCQASAATPAASPSCAMTPNVRSAVKPARRTSRSTLSRLSLRTSRVMNACCCRSRP